MSPPLSSSPRSSRFNREVLAGVLFLAIGLFFMLNGLGLSFGTMRKIGPGAFPAMVAGLLILTGFGLCVKGLFSRLPAAAVFVAPRPLLAVLGALVVFGVTVRGAGLLPAVTLCTLAAALAMRPLRLGVMALYGILAGIFCCAIFITALGMPMPVIGPWFRF